MARVAVFPLGAASHLASMTAAAGAMADSTVFEAITAFGPAPQATMFAQVGVPFVATRADAPPPGPADLRWRSCVRPLADIAVTVELAGRFAPDIVLYDCFSVYGPVVAHALSVPAVAFVTMPGFGTMPEGFAHANSWDRDDIMAADAEYARLFGLSLREAGLLPSFFPSRSANLVNTIPELFRPAAQAPCSDLRRQLAGFAPEQAVGRFMIDLSRPSPGQSGTALEIAARAKRQGQKVVLFSLGTVLTDFRYTMPVGGAPSGEVYLETLLETLRRVALERPEVCFIAACGRHFDPTGLLSRSPDNLAVVPVIPQQDLLAASADAFITHHGAASQAEAMIQGVPMIAVPGAGDQCANAAMTIAAGAAITEWDIADCHAGCTADRLAAAVDRALSDQTIAAASHRLGQLLRNANGSNLLANEIAAQLALAS